MRRILILVLVCVCLAGFAEARKVLIFSDLAFTDSTLTDNTPRVVNLYVVHTDFTHSVGVRFATEASAGFTGVWLSETSAYFTVGNSTTDISIAYGACLEPPVLALTMSYQLFGSSSCSSLGVVPPNGFPFIVCDEGCFGEYTCDGGAMKVNCPVATEPTTWGKVKALYRG